MADIYVAVVLLGVGLFTIIGLAIVRPSFPDEEASR